MGNIVFIRGTTELFRGSDLAKGFDLLFLLTAKVGDGVPNAGAADRFITILLQLVEPD